MQTYLLADPTRYPHMTTAQLRETFLMDRCMSREGSAWFMSISTERSWASRRRYGSQLL